MELLILLPVLLLMLAASMLVVSQIVGFFQYRRYAAKRRFDRGTIDEFVLGMSLAQTQLSRRSRDLEEATKRLSANNDELARLNTMKTKFLSMAVHDVRTPLTTVKGFAEMLGRGQGLNSKERQYVEYIRRATDQINALMGDLTDLAVIEAGKFKLEFENLEVSSLLAEVTPGIAFLSSRKGVDFRIVETPAPGAVVWGDRQRLARVLTNLLGNAVKFTPVGGVVELSVRVQGSKLHAAVRDTGPGIHPAERRRIFEKFYQSQYLKDKKAKAGGWGLGLSIAQEIVRSHGGEIGVDSPGLGKGSTFWVRLPAGARKPGRTAPALTALALLCLAASGARAQPLPLDEKSRFESSLEKKAEGVLLRLVGPNRYKVVVDATVDFTRVERFESRESTSAAKSRAGGYFWSAEAPAEKPDEALPGIPVPPEARAALQASRSPQLFERRSIYPAEFVKRLGVTVVLDEGLSPAKADEVRTIIADVLEITPLRGDTLSVVRAGFVPVWKTLWYEPETAGLILKYLLISLLSLLTLLVVAVCLLKLAGAMSDMAGAQTQQMTMEMRGAEDQAAALAGVDRPRLAADKGDASEPGLMPSGGPERVRFAVGALQVEALAEMLASEDPANIAVICAHVERDIARMLLDRLPEALATETMVHIGRTRYLEPDAITSLKEELERRLAGAVGGVGRLLELVESSDIAERGRILDKVGRRDPQLASRLRGRLFVVADLVALDKTDWARLLPKLSNAEWAAALAGMPEALAALEAAANPGQWRVLSQMIGSVAAGDDAVYVEAQTKLTRALEVFDRERRAAAAASAKAKEAGNHVA